MDTAGPKMPRSMSDVHASGVHIRTEVG
jgi:hypothetical protein